MHTKRDVDDVGELTADQDRELLERESRRLLNLTADQFQQRWNGGEFKTSDDPRVTQVAMLLPDAW